MKWEFCAFYLSVYAFPDNLRTTVTGNFCIACIYLYVLAFDNSVSIAGLTNKKRFGVTVCRNLVKPAVKHKEYGL